MTEKRKEPSMRSQKMWAILSDSNHIQEMLWPTKCPAIAQASRGNEVLGRDKYRVVRVTVTWDDRRATRRKP